MADNILPEPPAQLKAIQSYLKVASDIERVDPVVSYWVRFYCVETALKIDKDSADAKKFICLLIDKLEKFKQSNRDNEAVTNQTVGQAHYENFVFNLFNRADTTDRDGASTKSTVMMFYMAAVLFEAMTVFGPVSEEMTQRGKYAKFKAAYLQKCFRTGQTPKPGPIEGADLDDPSGARSDETGSSEAPSQPNTIDKTPSSLSDTSKSDQYILTPSVPPQSPLTPQTGISSNTPPQPSKLIDQPNTENSNAATADSSFNHSGTNVKSTIASTRFQAMNGAPLNPEDLIKSQKYCKFANSALLYDDVPTAVSNLEKALKLLTTGQNPD